MLPAYFSEAAVDEFLKAIVIKRPWIDLILAGKKTWEIRSRAVNTRGVIGLIEGGSGKVVGLARLTGCLGPMTAEQVTEHLSKHQVPPERMSEVPYKSFYAWELADVRRLNPPVRYKHPPGAVIWVRLDAKSMGAGWDRLLAEARQMAPAGDGYLSRALVACERPE